MNFCDDSLSRLPVAVLPGGAHVLFSSDEWNCCHHYGDPSDNNLTGSPSLARQRELSSADGNPIGSAPISCKARNEICECFIGDLAPIFISFGGELVLGEMGARKSRN